MSLEIFCGECGGEMDGDDIVCRACYDKIMAELEGQITALQETVDEQKKLIEDLEDEIRGYSEK